jgi:hypothetical protein
MAIGRTKIETTITLSLTTQEAYYLKGLTQNHLGIDSEIESDRKARESIFASLPSMSDLLFYVAEEE